MADELKRVILIKPGDTLLIGNVGSLDADQFRDVGKALRTLGFGTVAVFAGDISIDALRDVAGLPEETPDA